MNNINQQCKKMKNVIAVLIIHFLKDRIIQLAIKEKMMKEKDWCYVVMQKDLVQLYWTGYPTLPIHERDPTTARHGDFCLLRFRPGPVRLSLVNLDDSGSPPPTILMPGLARTPGRHRPAPGRCPGLKPSTDPGLRVAGLQEHATTPGQQTLR